MCDAGSWILSPNAQSTTHSTGGAPTPHPLHAQASSAPLSLCCMLLLSSAPWNCYPLLSTQRACKATARFWSLETDHVLTVRLSINVHISQMLLDFVAPPSYPWSLGLSLPGAQGAGIKRPQVHAHTVPQPHKTRGTEHTNSACAFHDLTVRHSVQRLSKTEHLDWGQRDPHLSTSADFLILCSQPSLAPLEFGRNPAYSRSKALRLLACPAPCPNHLSHVPRLLPCGHLWRSIIMSPGFVTSCSRCHQLQISASCC